MPLEPNTELGRYAIRSLIGTGGMGEIYLAEDTQLHRRIAVKVLPAEFVDSKERLKRFEREAFATSSLNHPNIITIHEIGESGGSYFIATEYVDGQSLRERMSAGDELELSEIIDIGVQVASAIAAAHSAGVIHRDIKPENIMVRRDGIVKVLDFGLAKLAEANDNQVLAETEAPTLHNTAPGIIMGTPAYMSPEQARAKGVDERTDIWSLGVVLYEMASGQLPFRGESTADTIGLVLHKEPEQLSNVDARIPPEFDRIVTKAITKNKDDRYQVVKDLGIDLRNLKKSLEFESARERVLPQNRETKERIPATAAFSTRLDGVSRTAEQLAKPTRPHRWGLAVAGVLAVAALASLAYLYLGGRTAPSINSVAVLPFVNVGNDPNAEYLSDGLTENVINNLSQLPQLKVISRGSAFKFKGKEIDIDAVAKALSVGAVVTGRVLQQGDDIQVSVEVVNTAENTQIFGSQFSGKAADLQAVQSQISRAIAENLRLQLTGVQEQQLDRASTRNPEAYQLFLKGRFFHRAGGLEGLQKAVGFLTQATTLDPNFALAYVYLASAYSNLAGSSVVEPKEATRKAKAALQRAMAADDKLAEAHSTLALLKTDEWDWQGAERSYRRAIELNPNLYSARANYSIFLVNVGRFEEALAEIKRAQELEPLLEVLTSEEGKVLFFARRYDEAIRRFQAHLKIEPENSFALFYLGSAYLAKGQHTEAIETFKKTISIEGDSTTNLCYLGSAYAREGRGAEARGILERVTKGEEYVSPAEISHLHLGLGDKEAAIRSLERAYAEHDLQLQFLKVDPDFDDLRSDPRFVDLVRRIGFPN